MRPRWHEASAIEPGGFPAYVVPATYAVDIPGSHAGVIHPFPGRDIGVG